MKITFIYHSCYVVEYEETVFVFDYYKGKLPCWDANKKVIFFASHKHQDHFSLDILRFAKNYNNVKYILSNDIKLTDKFLLRHGVNSNVKDLIVSVGKGVETLVDLGEEQLKIKTLRSTDEGVAFLITYQGKTIYHAGDLNWWSWHGESDADNEEMGRNYTKEIDKLTDRTIDVAFVVLDPRQEERYWWGLDYFLKTTDAKVVFPMHSWEKYWINELFVKEKEAEGYCDRVKVVKGEGDSFKLS